MKDFFVLGLALVLAGAVSQKSFADEHPGGSEHPTGAEHPESAKGEAKGAGSKAEPQSGAEPSGGVEPPKGEKDRGKKKDKKKGDDHGWNRGKVESDLTAFINGERARTSGLFVLDDDVTRSARKLLLERIHSDKIVRLSDGTSFVCADFKDASGDKVDVDFFMTPIASGGVERVHRIQIHKINGNARYTYVQKGSSWVQVGVN